MKDVIIFTDPFEDYQKALEEAAEKESRAKKNQEEVRLTCVFLEQPAPPSTVV